MNGVVTTHVWNGVNIVLKLNASGGVFNRFDRSSHGQLIRSEHHGFFLFNARGDVVQRVDVQSVILHTYRYDAFGNEISPTSSNTNRFRFASMYWDSHRGEYMTPNRMFNPRIGRWTQPDPYWGLHNMQNCVWSIMQSGNLFMYCMHNPVRFVDPLGLNVWVFYCGKDFVNQARKEGTRLQERYGGDLHFVTVRSINDFVRGWGRMAASGFVYGASIVMHGGPFTINIYTTSRNAEGRYIRQFLTTSNQNHTPTGAMAGTTNATYLGTLPRAHMNSLNIWTCSGGNLDFIYGGTMYLESRTRTMNTRAYGFYNNVAVFFLLNQNVGRVYGIDGNLAFGTPTAELSRGINYNPRLSWSQDSFHNSNSRRRLGLKRQPLGRVQFTVDNGAINWHRVAFPYF